MPQTPDHRAGPRYEDEIVFSEKTEEPTEPGALRYVGGNWAMRDGAETHNPTNANTLQLRPVSNIMPADKQPLAWDELNQDWRPRSFAEINVFGNEAQGYENNPMQETTSSSFVQHSRWSTTDLPEGNYYVSVQCTLDSGDDVGIQLEARIQLDDTTTLAKAALKPNVAVGGGTVITYIGLVELSGIHNFDFDYRKIQGSGTAGLRDVHGVLFRVS